MWEVETEYNVGDRVWLIYENKATEKTVTQLNVDVKDNGTPQPDIKITYELNNESGDFEGSRLFKSKEELLKSL